MAEKPIANRTVLAVFPLGKDQTSLARIFAHSHWKVRFTRLPQILTELSESPVGVIIIEAYGASGHCWKDVLLELQKMEDPPPLIVAGRLADERLWMEVLNLGAYDLLATPFDAKEIHHAVSVACRRHEAEQEMVARRKPTMSARVASSPGETRSASTQ